MVTITLTEADLNRLAAIDMDEDRDEALRFIRERILLEIRQRQQSRMKTPLNG